MSVIDITRMRELETNSALRDALTNRRLTPVSERLADSLALSPEKSIDRAESTATLLMLGVLAGEAAGVHDSAARSAALRAIFAIGDGASSETFFRLRRLVGVSGRHAAIDALFQYVDDLQAAARLGHAVDVLTLICRVSDEAIPTANLKLGYVLTAMGDLHRAEGAFQVCATTTSDAVQRLSANLGIGEAAYYLGDLARAAQLMDSVISTARRPLRTNDARMKELYGKALNSRSGVAGELGEHVDVVKYAAPALRYLTEPLRRDRAFLNIAIAEREIGRDRESARYATDVVRRTVDAHTRAEAMVLLYNLAVDRRDASGRTSYRAMLERTAMPSSVEAEFHLARSRDAAFDADWTTAMQSARAMIRLAEAHKLGKLAERGFRAMADLKRHIVPAVYEFRPAIVGSRTLRWLTRVERDLDGYCEAIAS